MSKEDKVMCDLLREWKEETSHIFAAVHSKGLDKRLIVNFNGVHTIMHNGNKVLDTIYPNIAVATYNNIT